MTLQDARFVAEAGRQPLANGAVVALWRYNGIINSRYVVKKMATADFFPLQVNCEENAAAPWFLLL